MIQAKERSLRGRGSRDRDRGLMDGQRPMQHPHCQGSAPLAPASSSPSLNYPAFQMVNRCTGRPTGGNCSPSTHLAAPWLGCGTGDQVPWPILAANGLWPRENKTVRVQDGQAWGPVPTRARRAEEPAWRVEVAGKAGEAMVTEGREDRAPRGWGRLGEKAYFLPSSALCPPQEKQNRREGILFSHLPASHYRSPLSVCLLTCSASVLPTLMQTTGGQMLSMLPCCYFRAESARVCQKLCVCALSRSVVSNSAVSYLGTTRPLSTEFPSQKYGSGLPFHT